MLLMLRSPNGLISRWTYATRVSTNLDEKAMDSTEKEIAPHLIPSLTGQPTPNEVHRGLLALPARLGGLGLINPTHSNAQHQRQYVHLLSA